MLAILSRFYTAVPTPKNGTFSKVMTLGKNQYLTTPPPVHKTPFIKIMTSMGCMCQA